MPDLSRINMRRMEKVSTSTLNPYERFVADLRTIRLAKGISQAALAKRIKLSRAQYTALENGRSLLNFVHLHNLSVALGVRFVIGDKILPFATRLV